MKKSFTLIELILVIAILGILAGLGLPFLITFKTNQDLDNTSEELVSALRKAQTRAISSEKDSSWGVNFSQPYRYILFREKFSLHDPENEVYEYSRNIYLTVLRNEVKFSKLKGQIDKEFIIDLTSFNKKRRITINQEGTIDYFRF